VNVPMGQDSQKAPRPEAEARLLMENISLPQGSQPLEENTVGLAGLEGYEGD
jgi:hypothetical protein